MITSTTIDYLDIARALAARPNDWPFAPRFDPSHRWYGRLTNPVEGDEAEAWLLTWLPGQGTDLHGHGGSAGAFVVLAGTLTERVATRARTEAEVFAATGRPTRLHLSSREFAVGQGHSFGPHQVHEVVNAGDRPAVSLHVYGPALRTMTRYRLLDGDLAVVAVEQAGVTW